MTIDAAFAAYSDLAFRSAFATYLLSGLLLAAQFTTTNARVGSAAVLVGGRATARETLGSAPGRIDAPPPISLSDRLSNMGMAVMSVGVVAHGLSIVLRGLATHRFPLGNMYEFISMATFAAALIGVTFLRGRSARPVLSVLLAPVLILMFLAGTVLYAFAAPVVPALQSYWLPVHVTVICLGSGVLMVSGSASVLYLISTREARRPSALARFAAGLPAAERTDQVAYRTAVVGFLMFGPGVILGAIWAEAAWGRFWGWDPKEVTAFVTWIVYAAYLHARATAGWRAKAAWINVAGFVAVLFNLFIVNVVVSGLHSYAGLS